MTSSTLRQCRITHAHRASAYPYTRSQRDCASVRRQLGDDAPEQGPSCLPAASLCTKCGGAAVAQRATLDAAIRKVLATDDARTRSAENSGPISGRLTTGPPWIGSDQMPWRQGVAAPLA